MKEFKGKFAEDNGRALIIDGALVAVAPLGITEYTIPHGVTRIGNCVFWNNDDLTSVTIPNSVTTIGYAAFTDCSNLKEVYCKSTTPPVLGNNQVFDNNASDRKIYVPVGSGEAYKTAEYWSEYADDIYEIQPSKNEIWYTNGSITKATMPYKTDAFDANIVSNLYDAEKGCWVITFDGNVTTIGNYAFRGCRLTSVTIGNSVTTIGYWAFTSCSSLTGVTIPDSVTTIGSGAFAGCDNLKEFKGKFAADNGRCLIKDNTIIAYAEASGTTYTIPNSVTTIGDSAFYGCTSLTSVTIPDSVTTIGYEAFYNCDSLTSVTIPDSVTTIEGGAFYLCDSLNSVTIPDSVTTIGNYTFSSCPSLKEFKGKYAADNGRCLIKDNTIIAYAEASGTTYTIPDSVTTIGYEAFYNCDSLTSVTIPDSVTTIDDHAFYGCGLTSVTIPDSVTTIGGGAFYGCSSLKEVYCKSTTPPALGTHVVFDSNASDRKIYVPAGSGNAYKTAEYWSEYADAIVEYKF